jgi:xanthine dehydrogenase accessory factor
LQIKILKRRSEDMEKVYSKALELVAKKQVSVLATIIRLTGSGPRGAGTKFLVMEDGSYAGTIGGGLLEAEVLREAGVVFRTGKPAKLCLSLMGKDVAETDMICGGDVEVFLEPVSPDDEQTKILTKSAEIQKRGGSGLLVTVVDTKRWENQGSLKVFLDSKGEKTGRLTGMKNVEDELFRTLSQRLEKRDPAVVFFL